MDLPNPTGPDDYPSEIEYEIGRPSDAVAETQPNRVVPVTSDPASIGRVAKKINDFNAYLTNVSNEIRERGEAGIEMLAGGIQAWKPSFDDLVTSLRQTAETVAGVSGTVAPFSKEAARIRDTAETIAVRGKKYEQVTSGKVDKYIDQYPAKPDLLPGGSSTTKKKSSKKKKKNKNNSAFYKSRKFRRRK